MNINLPEFGPLLDNQSTYITFSKALVDMDNAISRNEKWYFSNAVGINIPNWQLGKFFTSLVPIGITAQNPNIVMPKLFQYYMENILRYAPINDHSTELAFWKTLEYLGMSINEMQQSVVFSNKIALSNFITTENNNGWSEIVVQIPNRSAILIPKWKVVSDFPNIIQSTNTDNAIYDNGDKQYLFDSKHVLDFNNFTYDTESVSQFSFNVLLLFYTDASGVEKLHGINFIQPFENKVLYYELPRLTQKTNVVSNVGYQFKFNMKSCNNEATRLQVYELQEHTHWNIFGETLGRLDSFLELKMRQKQI